MIDFSSSEANNSHRNSTYPHYLLYMLSICIGAVPFSTEGGLQDFVGPGFRGFRGFRPVLMSLRIQGVGPDVSAVPCGSFLNLGSSMVLEISYKESPFSRF